MAAARAKAVVIMAAGLGTRMKSQKAKVLHPVAGRPMIHYPVRDALSLGADRVVVIVGHQREQVEGYLAEAFPGAPVTGALQAEQLGTAHAVLCAEQALADFEGDVFILSGDVPTLGLSMLQKLDEIAGEAPVALITMRLDDPAAYGRIVRDAEGQVVAITEARDCTPAQLEIDEVNAGIYRVEARFLFDTLKNLGNDNAQGEFYLTDVVARAVETGRAVAAMVLEGAEAEEAEGVNNRADLARAEGRMQRHIKDGLLTAGVAMPLPETNWIHDGVQVGPDTVIEPGACLTGNTRVGQSCHVGQGARLHDVVLADGARVGAGAVVSSLEIEADHEVPPLTLLD
ncbi:MAG: sugar phosphate nucleotidyltransferase [Bradymonadia bacterium]